jgi:hypothetical protein
MMNVHRKEINQTMDKRTQGIIATVAAVVLCGCPGLFLCIFGAFTATGNMPFNTELNGVSNSGTMPPTTGYVLVCLSLILVVIPVVVGFLTLRTRPTPPSAAEPIPPPS